MLIVGDEFFFDGVVVWLVELVYIWVDMVGWCGEFVVCGGILDIFVLMVEYLVWVEFWGDEIIEMWMFLVVDQCLILEIDIYILVVFVCCELLLSEDVWVWVV